MFEEEVVMRVVAQDDDTGDVFYMVGNSEGEVVFAILEDESEAEAYIKFSRGDIQMMVRHLLGFLDATKLSH